MADGRVKFCSLDLRMPDEEDARWCRAGAARGAGRRGMEAQPGDASHGRLRASVSVGEFEADGRRSFIATRKAYLEDKARQ
uniref:Uncharacterized protein n=1 Tax=Setaria viridis TaxID=4556 RepID=A0A4U6TB41_SETVI|nr:hypothetical protein SEVIR_9G568450v2 [Setaria viridis]